MLGLIEIHVAIPASNVMVLGTEVFEDRALMNEISNHVEDMEEFPCSLCHVRTQQ
jgi:hypothetical protein